MTQDELRARLARAYLADEESHVQSLIAAARFSPEEARAIDARARELVVQVRAGRRRTGGLDAFLKEYALTSDEGVVLMCLAEALLRVPDAATADKLIRDKIAPAQWEKHLGKSESALVNASTWGLMLTGRVIRLDDPKAKGLASAMKRIVTRSGEPVIRQAMAYAMRIMGEQFVLGRTIKEALSRADANEARGYRHSFDMLGEAAMTAADAARYFDSYRAAIEAIGAHHAGREAEIFARPSISVKLSALHPRYDYLQRDRVLRELLPRVAALRDAARTHHLGLTIDAEEADRLDLSLDLFAALTEGEGAAPWNGLGLAVQAYQKRGLDVIAWLAALARRQGRRIPVRLVKGAYWDSEIKRGQEQGLSDYPVFTRKAATDMSYLACMRALLGAGDAFYPQFATHNAHTAAAALVLGKGAAFEFQRLHGMGDALYDAIVTPGGQACRVYAPVGSHEDLLAYLVRRLLENGANTSFVNRLADDEAPIGEIVADPVAALDALPSKRHPRIPKPRDLFSPRLNSPGVLLSDPAVALPLLEAVQRAAAGPHEALPVIDGRAMANARRAVVDPADPAAIVGHVGEAMAADAARALDVCAAAQSSWDELGGAARADILERAASLMETRIPQLIALCVKEAGKTLVNAQGDVREAIDFLRYYAAEARWQFSGALALPGPTGERNTLALKGRGVFACIAPWNFPVAIFTGQVAAALAAGNGVIAKPAEQTPLTAAAVISILHEAGVPGGALAFLPGDGPTLGRVLLSDPRLAGVAFTGSTETARVIARALAAREGALATLIAETGGQNAMIVDSTALPEQVVRDAVTSAFDSAGQRCSALRVLFVQEDIAPRVIDMIAGAMDELTIGDPMRLSTDIGPVIDNDALQTLAQHAERMTREGKHVHTASRLEGAKGGYFFAPRAFEIDSLARLTREVFGPILHIVRYRADRLDQVCDAINATGYGLTLSIHSRTEAMPAFVRARVRAGNVYVNRNQIGAVVGAQPFGGEGLSGTGPKAGGPHYLPRFAVERVVSVNTAAAGGNTALLSLSSEG